MRNLAILQARMASQRLPGKVMRELNGKPLIFHLLSRIQETKVDNVVLATSTEKSDDELVDFVKSLGIQVHRGSMNDVHSRFLTIINEHRPQNFLRLTGDCPLIMPSLINSMIDYFEIHPSDYLSNSNPPTFPDGLDVEIVSTKSFLKFSEMALEDDELEHVTLGMYRRSNMFTIRNFSSSTDYSDFRWTVDYPEDLDFVTSVYQHFKGREKFFEFDEVVELIRRGIVKDNTLTGELRNIALKSNKESESND